MGINGCKLVWLALIPKYTSLQNIVIFFYYSQIAYDINEIESGSAFAIWRTNTVSKSMVGFMTGSRNIMSAKEMGRLFVPSSDLETRFFPPFPIYKSMRAYVRSSGLVGGGRYQRRSRES